MSSFLVADTWEVRSPAFWRDLYLGLFWGFAFVWASFDALHWSTFSQNALKELIFLGIPVVIGMLSPRRLLVTFVGLCLPFFRFMFLMFVLESFWSVVGVLIWALILVAVGKIAIRKYRGTAAPDGITGGEVLLSIAASCVTLLAIWQLRVVVGLPA